MILPLTVSGFLIIAAMPRASAQQERAAAANEGRQVQFAERVVMIELTRKLSMAVRLEQEKCPAGCPESGALTLGVGSIGCGRTSKGTESLIDMIGLKLDGEGAEERTCQLLVRGRLILKQLQALDASQIASRCRSRFAQLRERELSGVADVSADSVCHAANEILGIRDEIVSAISAGQGCEE